MLSIYLDGYFVVKNKVRFSSKFFHESHERWKANTNEKSGFKRSSSFRVATRRPCLVGRAFIFEFVFPLDKVVSRSSFAILSNFRSNLYSLDVPFRKGNFCWHDLRVESPSTTGTKARYVSGSESQPLRLLTATRSRVSARYVGGYENSAEFFTLSTISYLTGWINCLCKPFRSGGANH